MLASERMQVERFELGDAANDRALQASGRWAVPVTTAILAVVALALVGATIGAVEGWAHAVVIGAIVMTTIGLMIAVAPRRV